MSAINLRLFQRECFACQKKISQKAIQNHDYWMRPEGIYHSKCWLTNWEEENKDALLREADNWEAVVKNYPCSSCDINFTEQELKEKNYQVSYSVDKYYTKKDPCQEIKEIYNIKHLDCLGPCWCSKCQVAHEELKESQATCFICRKRLGNLVVISRMSETSYHSECWESKKPSSLVYKWHIHPKLLKLEIQANKITAYLEDKREISILISELAKRWREPHLTAEQLKEYEIFADQFAINFPIADIYTNVLIFTGNCCCCF